MWNLRTAVAFATTTLIAGWESQHTGQSLLKSLKVEETTKRWLPANEEGKRTGPTTVTGYCDYSVRVVVIVVVVEVEANGNSESKLHLCVWSLLLKRH